MNNQTWTYSPSGEQSDYECKLSAIHTLTLKKMPDGSYTSCLCARYDKNQAPTLLYRKTFTAESDMQAQQIATNFCFTIATEALEDITIQLQNLLRIADSADLQERDLARFTNAAKFYQKVMDNADDEARMD